jgi:Uma2 family endonuclease
MLINFQLPLDRHHFLQQDRVLNITGATWHDYQQFNSPEYSGYRVSYFDGEIIIVSPGRNHERITETIDRLIIAYCEKYNLLDFPFRQTRLEVEPFAGKEPDIAYAFNLDKDLPDLAVEVIFSSGDLDNLLTAYQNIGISELWIWKNDRLTFYYLDTIDRDGYVEVNSSRLLPKIKAESLVKFVNRGLNESPSMIKKDFLLSLI